MTGAAGVARNAKAGQAAVSQADAVARRRTSRLQRNSNIGLAVAAMDL